MIDLVIGLSLYFACGLAVSFVMLHIIDAVSVRRDRRRGNSGDNGSAVERTRGL